jgi:hypothetical protein
MQHGSYKAQGQLSTAKMWELVGTRGGGLVLSVVYIYGCFLVVG